MSSRSSTAFPSGDEATAPTRRATVQQATPGAPDWLQQLRTWTRDPIVAACAMMLALMLWGASAAPLFNNSDEVFHLAAVFTTTDGDGWPSTLTELQEERVPAALLLLEGQWDGDYSVGAAPGSRGDADDLIACRAEPATCTSTFSLREWHTEDSMARSRGLQHPPLYYALAGAALTALSGTVPMLFGLEGGQTVWLLRVLTALAMVPIPWIASRVAHQVGLSRAAEVAAATATLAVPGMVYTGPAALGPDALLILMSSVVILLAIRLDPDSSAGRLVAFGVAMGVNAFIKSPGLAVNMAAVLVTLPILLAGGARAAVRRLGLVGLPALATGGWWWLRNIVVLGQFQPLLNDVQDPQPTALTPGVVITSTLEWGEKTLRAFWGLFLIGNNGANLLRFWLVTLVLALAVLGAVAAVHHQRFRAFSVISLGVTVLMVWGTMIARLASLGAVRAMQGRYLYPLIVVLAVGLAGLISALVGRRRARWTPAVIAVAILAWQAFAAVNWISRYGGPESSLHGQAAAWIAWFPGPPWLAYTVAGACAFSAVWLILTTLRPPAEQHILTDATTTT